MASPTPQPCRVSEMTNHLQSTRRVFRPFTELKEIVLAACRQYYLPRSLERALLDPGSGDAQRIRLDRRTCELRLIGIHDAGVGAYCSSQRVPGEVTFDARAVARGRRLRHRPRPTCSLDQRPARDW